MGFVKCGYYGYSPDGFIDDNGLIEIKCQGSAKHIKYFYDGEICKEYTAQMQGGLLATGREWCDFCSYHPDFTEDKRLFIKRVYRDEAFIKTLDEALLKFDELKNEILGNQ